MNPDEHHVALPKLYGAPAYARPPRVFEENGRPPDPDDLPLEAFRDDDGLATAASTFEPPAAEPPRFEPDMEPPRFEPDMEPPMSSSSGSAASDATTDAAMLDPSMPGDAVAGAAEPDDVPPAAGQGPWADPADADDGEAAPGASDIVSAGEPLEPIEAAAEADVPPATETAAPAAPFSLRALGRLIQRR